VTTCKDATVYCYEFASKVTLNGKANERFGEREKGGYPFRPHSTRLWPLQTFPIAFAA
jgi:hypothetical protein